MTLHADRRYGDLTRSGISPPLSHSRTREPFFSPHLYVPQSDVVADPGVGRLGGRYQRVVVHVLLRVGHQAAETSRAQHATVSREDLYAALRNSTNDVRLNVILNERGKFPPPRFRQAQLFPRALAPFSRGAVTWHRRGHARRGTWCLPSWLLPGTVVHRSLVRAAFLVHWSTPASVSPCAPDYRPDGLGDTQRTRSPSRPPARPSHLEGSPAAKPSDSAGAAADTS